MCGSYTQQTISFIGPSLGVYLKNLLHSQMIINELSHRARLHSSSQSSIKTRWALAFFFFLTLSTRARASTHTHIPPHPPIETGYQSYLLNLMHALSTHSRPVTSALNIETGFAGITRTFISQDSPPLPTPSTSSLWPEQTSMCLERTSSGPPCTTQPRRRQQKRVTCSANGFNLLFNGQRKQ